MYIKISSAASRHTSFNVSNQINFTQISLFVLPFSGLVPCFYSSFYSTFAFQWYYKVIREINNCFERFIMKK